MLRSAPDGVKQLAMADGVRRMTRKLGQEAIFPRGQMHLGSRARDAARRQVDLDRPDPDQRRGGLCRPSVTQRGPYPREHLDSVGAFGHIVVPANVERRHLSVGRLAR